MQRGTRAGSVCVWRGGEWRGGAGASALYRGRGVSAEDCMQTIKVNSSSEKWNFCFFSFSSFTIDFKISHLKYHIFHLTYFDYTLPILQNFEKTICVKILIELHSRFLHSNCFLKVLKNCERTEREKAKKSVLGNLNKLKQVHQFSCDLPH